MANQKRHIAIIGTGFSGLCLAIRLKKAGIHSFTLFEKSDRVGGTWRDNTYPGAACDTPAFSYCFSFEQKTDWSRKWAPQEEILAYIEHCVSQYGLREHIRFNSEITAARFDEGEGAWRIRMQTGEEFTAAILVSGVGQLNRPAMPDLPGLDRFAGVSFHSARWNRDFDLAGKRLAVIGNAASAIQFVPQIAKQAAEVHIFQRSANWMIPRFDRAYSSRERQRFARFPLLSRLYRAWIWLVHELRFPAFRKNKFVSRRLGQLAERYMRSVVKDRELQAALVPDYPVGGKRILISDDYYQTLNRENVHVITDPIDHLEEDGVVTKSGAQTSVDAVILATGFQTTDFLVPMTIEGLRACSLESEWKDGARAYLGITISGFPNFFMMYGPNTNLGHNSIIFMIECQAQYILGCIQAIIANDLKYIDLRQDVLESFNQKLQGELDRTVWATTRKSWYKNAAGKITNNWSGTTARYWWKTRRPDLASYHRIPRKAASQ